MSNFIADYLIYNAPNEVPDTYTVWGALFLLGATAQRRVYCTLSKTPNSYDQILPNLYLGFIGSPASGKSFGKDRAKDIFIPANPQYYLGSSRQSLESIASTLAKDDTQLNFFDAQGDNVSTHSMTFFINELKNWLAINPIGMIDFLTDIYDVRMYDAATIKHGLQVIEMPCINILACETDAWIRDNFKRNILSGGFARRFVCIYYPGERNRKADQSLHPEHIAAKERCIAHLSNLQSLVGRFVWTEPAWKFYSHWYETTRYPTTNAIMQQFYGSKNILTLKLAMILAMAEYEPKLELTEQNLVDAIATIDGIEPDMLKLFQGVGRNELAVPTQRIFNLIETNGGRMSEKQLIIAMQNDITQFEYQNITMQLFHTEQLYKVNAIIPPDQISRVWICSPAFAAKLKKIN